MLGLSAAAFLAAAFSYNFDAAEHCLRLHKSFAKRVRAIGVREASGNDLAELGALAPECRLSRGGICKVCGLAQVHHGGPPAT